MLNLKILLLLILSLFFISSTYSQIKVTKVEKAEVAPLKQWSNPHFSPDGKSIFFSTINYDGIWEYSIENKSTKIITEDLGAGFGFTVSSDGKNLLYRKSQYDIDSHQRNQEIIKMDLITKSSEVIDRGSDLSIPISANNRIIYSKGKQTKNLLSPLSVNEINILGIEDTKIVMSKNGEKTILDPFDNGSYIWASLSPDNQKIVAYEMDRGTFICDLKGRILVKLGRRDAPIWTRDGKWIIYMNDKDDGNKLISSEIFCISPDGKTDTQLTHSDNTIKMYPASSPKENKIVYCTLNSEIFILSYEEISK
jgi:Tol biopolymer transport system component